MRITILNAEPDATAPFDAYVRGVAERLTATGHDVTHVVARDLDLKGCTGCWGCWVKTPGECVRHDDSALIARTFINSELVVFASPVHMGFTSSLLKRVADQMIGLVHPYIMMEHGEMHHRPRYPRYPLLALLLAPDADTDAEDLAITEHLWARMARNMKSKLAFAAVADRSIEEVADEFAPAA
jgi:hypothetical protein